MSDTSDYGASPVKDTKIIHQLGSVTAGWAALDNILVELLCRLLRDDPAGEVIYYTLNSFKSRVDVIANLITELMDDTDRRKKDLLQLLDKISELSLKRNEMVHSAMTLGEDNRVIRRVRRPGRKVSSRSVEVKASDMAQHAQVVGATGFEILMLINPVVAAEATKMVAQNGLMEVSGEDLEKLREGLELAYPLRRPPAAKTM